MFNEFPYTDVHQLNLDWISKVAKDFLDQYTHIQQVIQTGLNDLAQSRETGLADLAESRETGLAELDQKRLSSLAELNQKALDGLADLQTKYDTLNGLLQAWYDTHSADIAGQLATAIADFNSAAEAKSRALLDSWPADYSELVTGYNDLVKALNDDTGVIVLSFSEEGKYINTSGSTVDITDIQTSEDPWRYAIQSCSEGDIFVISGLGGGLPRLWAFCDSSNNVLSAAINNLTVTNLVLVAPENASYIIVNDREGKVSYKNKPVRMKIEEINSKLTAIKNISFEPLQLLKAPIDFSSATIGQYISSTGTIIQSDSHLTTQPIELKKGETIIFQAAGYLTNLAMIAKYADGTYTPVVYSTDSEVKNYSYKASDDCNVVLSCSINLPYYAVISGLVTKAVNDYLINDIDFTNEIWGRYINVNGGISSGANDFRYTPPVTIKAHMKIVFTAAGYNQSVCMIAKYNGENVNMTPLVISTESEVNTYTYDLPETMQICFSYNKTKNHSGYYYVDYESMAFNEDKIDYSVLFPKMSVIGDSLSSGELYYNGGYNDRYGDSWLSMIAQTCGCKRNHYANGGVTAKMWIDTYSEKLVSDTASDLYFIALGTNDAYLEPYPIGTASDSAGTNTFAGWYKQIIETVRTKAPSAAIMCLSLYKDNDTWNDLIKNITDLYSNVYYLDFIGNSEIDTDTGGLYSAGSHFTTLGYHYVANVILKQMNKIVKENLTSFKFYGYNNMIEEKYEFE